MGNHHGLSVRRHQRHEVSLSATLTLFGASAEAVRFSTGSSIDGGAIAAMLLDLGEGGLGLRTACFVPRGAEVRVAVHGPGDSVVLTATARVRRVSMVERGPEYLMGLSFMGDSAEIASHVAAVRAVTCGAPTGREGARDG